jgi:hypothetical protein
VNGQEAFFPFGRGHDQFDLPTLDEIDRISWIAALVDLSTFRQRDGMRILDFAPQRITQ